MDQKTIQVLDTLAEEYSTFEATMNKVTFEHEEGDVLYAVASEVADELERAKRTRTVCKTNSIAPAKTWPPLPGNSPIVGPHEEICVEARKVWQRTYDLKRKASEAQDNVFSYRERTRRISNEHARAEALVNDGLGSLGQAVRAAAQATHSLTCGVPDRESNEIKYLREATELIERWQQQLQDGQPVSRPPSKHSEVIFLERQWC